MDANKTVDGWIEIARKPLLKQAERLNVLEARLKAVQSELRKCKKEKAAAFQKAQAAADVNGMERRAVAAESSSKESMIQYRRLLEAGASDPFEDFVKWFDSNDYYDSIHADVTTDDDGYTVTYRAGNELDMREVIEDWLTQKESGILLDEPVRGYMQKLEAASKAHFQK